MIERYSDHAANERTFLAWVRTAIAIMAFGFVVAKFDLFLRLAGAEGSAKTVPGGHSFIGDIAGVLLFVLGAAIMALVGPVSVMKHPRYGTQVIHVAWNQLVPAVTANRSRVINRNAGRISHACSIDRAVRVRAFG